MTEMIPWEQIRTDAIEQGRVTEEAIAQAKVEMDAQVAGYHLAELRQKTGMTQVQVAEVMGVSQARVSAMERGDVDSLTVASVRAYITALGGTVRIVASLDDTDITLRLPEGQHTTAA
jgi:DNA-binding XRE family transcriptional regulator